MSRILSQSKEAHELLVKEAVLGLMARAGKLILRNPIKSLGVGATVGFNALDWKSGTKKLTDAANGGQNIMPTGRVNL